MFEWKYHLIRNQTQDQIKYEILNNLKEDEIYVHMDWAMKFMPQKFREKQEEFFGKRGINWHISCVVFQEKNYLSCLTFIHLFESVSQYVDAIIGITDSVFEQIKKQLGKKKIYLRTNNAGCYHNNAGCLSE